MVSLLSLPFPEVGLFPWSSVILRAQTLAHSKALLGSRTLSCSKNFHLVFSTPQGSVCVNDAMASGGHC